MFSETLCDRTGSGQRKGASISRPDKKKKTEYKSQLTDRGAISNQLAVKARDAAIEAFNRMGVEDTDDNRTRASFAVWDVVKVAIDAVERIVSYRFDVRYPEISEDLRHCFYELIAKKIHLFDPAKGSWTLYVYNATSFVMMKEWKRQKIKVVTDSDLCESVKETHLSGPSEVECEENSSQRAYFASMLLSCLSDRNAEIVRRYWMSDQKETLEEIGGSLGITRERVRQILAASRLQMLERAERLESVREAAEV